MNNIKLPNRYLGQVTQGEYDIVTRHSVDFLKEKATINKIDDGIIYVELIDYPKKVTQLSLDNLLRTCKLESDKAKWKEIIVDHFTRLISRVEFDKSNFDKCRDLLSIRIYPEYDEKTKSLMTFKVDFPGTVSALVVDLPDSYESISNEIIEQWNVPVDSLFYMAQQNVNKRDDMQVLEAKGETFKLYSFLSIDHSASYIRDIEVNADFAVGESGAFIAIPTRGAAFAVPIDDKNAMEALDVLRPMAKMFFAENPGNITAEIFWYNFEGFEQVSFVEGKAILPEKLETMI
jgi:hypothetical protein